MDTLIRRIHALLFVAGEEGISRENLAAVLEQPLQSIEKALVELRLRLNNDQASPIELVHFNNIYRLLTKSDLESDLELFAQSSLKQALSRAAIETLAIIAYRQPITRMEIDGIRGVSSQAMVQKLLMRDLIKEVGRIEAPGRPVLYGVTPYFMDYFALESLDDLPAVQPLSLSSLPVSESLFSTKEWDIDWFEEEE